MGITCAYFLDNCFIHMLICITPTLCFKCVLNHKISIAINAIKKNPKQPKPKKAYNKTVFSFLTGFYDVFFLPSPVLLVADKPTSQPRLA